MASFGAKQRGLFRPVSSRLQIPHLSRWRVCHPSRVHYTTRLRSIRWVTCLPSHTISRQPATPTAVAFSSSFFRRLRHRFFCFGLSYVLTAPDSQHTRSCVRYQAGTIREGPLRFRPAGAVIYKETRCASRRSAYCAGWTRRHMSPKRHRPSRKLLQTSSIFSTVCSISPS